MQKLIKDFFTFEKLNLLFNYFVIIDIVDYNRALFSPLAGMGLMFGTSLCLCGKIRQKTDVTNHVISGALAGAVWGVKCKYLVTNFI